MADVGPLRESFLRHLAAENKSSNTLLTYGLAVQQFADFTVAAGTPRDVDAITREHVESFLIDLQGRGWKPSSVASRYRSLALLATVAGTDYDERRASLGPPPCRAGWPAARGR